MTFTRAEKRKKKKKEKKPFSFLLRKKLSTPAARLESFSFFIILLVFFLGACLLYQWGRNITRKEAHHVAFAPPNIHQPNIVDISTVSRKDTQLLCADKTLFRVPREQRRKWRLIKEKVSFRSRRIYYYCVCHTHTHVRMRSSGM